MAVHPQRIFKTLPWRAGRSTCFVLGLLALLAGILLLPHPVAAQTNITPQNPCFASTELTDLTVTTPGAQNLRGIANQPVISRNGDRVAYWSTNDLQAGQNQDGNIEVFYQLIGTEQSEQLTASLGTILGGFNLAPSINADGNRVAFFSDRDLVRGRNSDGNFEIFLGARANNGTWTLRQITDTQIGANLFPSISADGTRIAFVSDEQGLHNVDDSRSNPDQSFQVFLATVGGAGNPDGVTFRQITQTGIGVTNDEPVISNDGQRIAFTQAGSQGPQIYLWDAATPNSTVRLTENNTNDQPTINADGSRIAYVSTTGGGRSRIILYVQGDAQTGDRSEVIVPQSATTQYRSPSISDDGLRVVYVAETSTQLGPTVEVFLFDASVHSQGGVPITTGSTEQPSISGNGSQIVYVGLATDTTSSQDVGSQIRITECPLADLVLEPLDPIPTNVLAGIDLTYSFRVTNNGPSTAQAARATLQDIARPNLVTISTELTDERCSLSASGLTCNFGDLAPGASTEFTVGWDVPANAGLDDIRSRLTAASNAIDPNPDTADTGVLVTRVTEVANLVLSKSGSDDTIQAGANTPFLYTLTLVNEGPSRARDAVVIDTLPNNVQIVGSVALDDYIVQSSNPDAECSITQANKIVRCELGSVPADTTTIIRIPITANPGAPAQLTNRAEVQSETEDLTPETRSATLTTSVFRPADLVISKSVEPGGSVIAGERITYTLVVTNLGTANAANVSVTDLLPQFVTYVETDISSPECTPAANNTVVDCQLGSMTVAQEKVLTIVGRVAPDAPAGIISNSASVVSARPDPNSANNDTDAIETQVIRVADVEVVSKTASPAPVVAGNVLRYTLTIRNNGPSTAIDTVVTDTLPSNVTVVGLSDACSQEGVAAVICDAGTLAPDGDDATQVFTIDVVRTQTGQINNSAAVGSATLDNAPGNNADSIQVTVRPAPTSQLVFTNFPNSVGAGQISTSFRVQRRDEFGNANNIEGALTLNLSTTQPANGTFRAAGDPNTPITSIQIPANQSSVELVYRDELAGTPTLTASAPGGSGITPAQRTITVNPGPASQLVILTTEHTVVAGVVSPEITVQRQDAFGNPNTAQPALTVLLDATSDDGVQGESFRTNESPFDTEITSIQITQDNSTATFRYYDERAGTKTLELTDQANVVAGTEQDIEIVPAPTERVIFTNEPYTLTASTTPNDLNQQFRVERVDEFGNPNLTDPTLTVALAATPSDGEFFSSGGAGPIDSVVIAQGSSFIQFTFADPVVGDKTLSAERQSGGGPQTIFPGVQVVTIIAAPAAALTFEPNTDTIVAGNLTDAFNVVRRDEFGNLADEDGEIIVALDTASADGEFRNAVNQANEIASVTLGDGVAQAPIRYYDELAGDHTLTGEFTGLDPATATITVLADEATQLVIDSDEHTITAGQVSNVITVQRRDQFDNPADQDPQVTVTPETSSGPGAFSSNASGTPTVTTVNILANTASASVYYTDTLAGAHTITFTAALLGNPTASVSQGVTVNPDQAFALNFSTPEHTTEAGVNSDTMTVERRDQFGNLNTADAAVNVNLSTSVPISATFVPPSPIEIAQGTSEASFSYRSDWVGPGVHTITASAVLPQDPGAFATQSHTITAGAADYLQVRGPEPEPVAGVAQTLSITAFDSFGNLAVGYDGEQTLRFAGAPLPLGSAAVPNVTDKDGNAQDIGEAANYSESDDTLLDFVDGVAVTDASRGRMTLYRAGAYTITARADANGPYAQLLAQVSNAFAVDVQQGPLDDFQIQDAPAGEGEPIPDQDLRSGEDLPLYAVAVDQWDNGLPEETVQVLQWLTHTESSSVFGLPVVIISPTVASTVTTVTGNVSGTVTIKAVISSTIAQTETDPTGVITVIPGDVASVNVETDPDNVVRELVPSQSVTASNSITVYATLRDAAGNLVPLSTDDSDVDWALTDTNGGGVVDDDLVDNLAPSNRQAVFTGDAVGTAVISATVPGSPSLAVFPSGVISVVAGQPAGLEIRRSSDNATSIDVEAGTETGLVIRVYDANGNIATNTNGTRNVTFFGADPSPNSTLPTVSQHSDGTPIAFGTATSLNFSQGVMTGTVQGRMTLYAAGSQVITASLTLPNSSVIGTRSGGQLSADVAHSDLDNFDLSLSEPQTNTLAFVGANTVTARDAYANPVLDYSAVVTPLTFSATGGTVEFDTNDDTIDNNDNVANGVVDLTAYAMTFTGTANTDVTFTVTSTASSATGNATIAVRGGPAQELVVTSGIADPPNVVAGETLLTFQARDGQGNDSPSYAGDRTLVFGKTGTTLPAFPPYVTDKDAITRTFGTNTVLTFGVTGSTAFTVPMGLFAAQPDVTVTFTDTNNSPPPGVANPLTGTFVVTVVADALDSFDFALDSPQAVGEPFTGVNTLTPIDPYGNVAIVQAGDAPVNVTPASSGTVTFTAATNGDNTLVPADFSSGPGVADLTALGMEYAGETGTFTFTATSNSGPVGVSNEVTFTSDTPTRLEVTGDGGPEVAGTPFTLTVTARDSFGNVANAYNETVGMVFGGASLAPDDSNPQALGSNFGVAVAVEFVSGVAEINSVTLVAAESANISATIAGGTFNGVTSDPAGNYSVTVNPGDAVELHADTSPATGQTAGVALTPSPVVQLRDQFENVRTGDSASTISAAVEGPGDFTGGSTTALSVTAGVATFGSLVLETAGFYTLTFGTDEAGVPDTTGITFTVEPGAADHITLTPPNPAAVTAGETSEDFFVAVFDQFGNLAPVTSPTTVNLATSATGVYTFTPSPATLNASEFFTSFTYADEVVGTKNITATVASGDAGLVGDTAATTITVNAAAPVALEFTGPASAPAGANSDTFTVTVRDGFGNLSPVSQNTDIDLATTSGGTVVFTPGIPEVANGQTQTTFIYNDDEAGTQTVTATVESGSGQASLVGAEDTHAIQVQPGVADALVITTEPDASQTAGETLTPTITVELRDEFGNALTNDNASTVAVSANGPAALASGTTPRTVAAGVASFDDLVLETAGVYSLTFTSSAGAAPADSVNFTVEPNNATTLSLSSGNNQTATVGTALANPLAVVVTDNYSNPVSGVSVTFGVTGGGGSFANNAPVATGATGIATSTAWTLGTTAGVNTANATSAGLAGSPVGFNATGEPDTLDALVIQVQPSNTTTDTVISPSPEVALVDQYNNVLVDDDSSSVTASVTGGFAGGSTTEETVLNGVAVFDNLSISSTGTYTITFDTAGADPVVSDSFDVNPP